MLLYLKIFIVTFIIFMIIDLIWLGFIAKNIYAKYLKDFLSPNVNWAAAIIFYIIFILGMIFFVINPALEKDCILCAIFVGALYGFITYSTYDLTNLATLKDWPLKITLIDILWGTFLSSSTSTISFLITRNF